MNHIGTHDTCRSVQTVKAIKVVQLVKRNEIQSEAAEIRGSRGVGGRHVGGGVGGRRNRLLQDAR